MKPMFLHRTFLYKEKCLKVLPNAFKFNRLLKKKNSSDSV